MNLKDFLKLKLLVLWTTHVLHNSTAEIRMDLNVANRWTVAAICYRTFSRPKWQFNAVHTQCTPDTATATANAFRLP